MRPSAMNHPEKILIIQTAFLGDVILATALLEKLHRFFPHATLDFLVRKGNESLFDHHPFVRQIICWDKKRNKIKHLAQIIAQVRAEKYDIVINLQRFFSSGLLTLLSGAGLKIGFKKNPLSFATQAFPHEIGNDSHEVDRNLRLIEFLTDDSKQLPRLYPSQADYKAFSPKVPYICIAPASVWFTKQWPAEKWAALISALDNKMHIYLIGSPADNPLCEKIINESSHQHCTNLCGKLSLLASAALIKGASMNYVNDSAPMHLASAMNAPVTAIYCSTVPEFGFTPLSDNARIVQTPVALDCRPCGLHGYKKCPKGHFKCANIPINLVLAD